MINDLLKWTDKLSDEVDEEEDDDGKQLWP